MNHYKTRIVLFLTFSVFSLFSKLDAANPVAIKIKIKGVKDTTCLLANHYGDKQYIQDTLKVDSQGRMTIDRKEKYDGGIYLIVIPNKKYFEFIMDEGQNFSIETDTTDFIKNMKIKGSSENELFYQYLNFINGKGKEVEPLKKALDKVKDNKDSSKIYVERISAIDKQVNDYRVKFSADNKNTFAGKVLTAMTEIKIPEVPILANGRKDSTFSYRYYKAHFWDNIDFSDDRLLRTPVYHAKLKQYMENMVLQVPDSLNKEADWLLEKTKNSKELYKYTAHYITYTYESSKIMGMDAVFVHMVEKVHMPGKAYWLDSAQVAKIINRAIQLKPVLLGKVAPDLTLLDSSMAYHSLHNSKGKYTVLYFWDYGCGHCKKETPKLQELYEKYKNKGLEVFAVGTEYDAKEWKKFIIDNKLTFLNVYDPYHQSNFKHIYDIFSTPVVYLLNDKKEIVAKRIGVEQLDDMLKNYLK